MTLGPDETPTHIRKVYEIAPGVRLEADPHAPNIDVVLIVMSNDGEPYSKIIKVNGGKRKK